MLRAAVASGTPVGKKAKAFMDKGELVPDELVVDVVFETSGRHEGHQGLHSRRLSAHGRAGRGAGRAGWKSMTADRSRHRRSRCAMKSWSSASPGALPAPNAAKDITTASRSRRMTARATNAAAMNSSAARTTSRTRSRTRLEELSHADGAADRLLPERGQGRDRRRRSAPSRMCHGRSMMCSVQMPTVMKVP